MGVLVKNGKSYTGTGDLLIQPVIYSDDERCIGVWRDGKPLYQKTISFDDTMFQTDGSGKKITVTIPDVEAIKTSQVFIENNVLPITYAQGSLYISYWTSVSATNTVDIVFRYSSEVGSNLHTYFINSTAIIQYTKTTDTAGTAAWVPTGATPIHYSLNEQVIGTWIDGKPLYQKTVDCGALPNATIKNVPHGIDNFGDLVSIFGVARHPDYQICIPYTGVTDRLVADIYHDVIEIVSATNMSSYTKTYITLQYTKTTD